ncbi:MAG TPA: hypothetical protein VFU02_14565 [Polyangiaceae bacterium]|nr:hypothetical protein [Polyangiaceae bacterium]
MFRSLGQRAVRSSGPIATWTVVALVVGALVFSAVDDRIASEA